MQYIYYICRPPGDNDPVILNCTDYYKQVYVLYIYNYIFNGINYNYHADQASLGKEEPQTMLGIHAHLFKSQL